MFLPQCINTGISSAGPIVMSTPFLARFRTSQGGGDHRHVINIFDNDVNVIGSVIFTSIGGVTVNAGPLGTGFSSNTGNTGFFAFSVSFVL